MKFMTKLKLLFIVQKPANQIAQAIEDGKTSRKKYHVIAAVLGIIVTSSADWAGFLPPQYALIITSVIIALYTIARGADKAEEQNIKGYFTSSEFYGCVAGAGYACFEALKAGGINPGWMAGALALLMAASGSGQNLAARAPVASTSATLPVDPKIKP